MALGNVGETVGGAFDSLKSRLGFDRGADRYDDYDEYGEYGDYDEFEEYGEKYDSSNGYNDSSVGGYRPLSSTTRGSNRYAKSDISSSLVSIDDVKASTPLPDTLSRDPLEYTGSSSYARAGAGAYGAGAGASGYGTVTSPGVNSLFEPTTPAVPASSAGAVPTASSSAGAGSYDPYVAYSSANPSSHAPARSLTVVRPTAYGDVERVARAVKSGDVVVLAMKSTPDDLSKRILDFSFGVASALDANVECPGEKVFAIARGNALTPDEKRQLGVQGVL